MEIKKCERDVVAVIVVVVDVVVVVIFISRFFSLQ